MWFDVFDCSENVDRRGASCFLKHHILSSEVQRNNKVEPQFFIFLRQQTKEPSTPKK
jgi:hypothetical protein